MSTPRTITRRSPRPLRRVRHPILSGMMMQSLLQVPALARGFHDRRVVGPVEEENDLLGVDRPRISRT